MSYVSPIREKSGARLATALLLALAVSGCAGTSVSSIVPPPQQPTVTASISICNKTPDACADAQTFSLAQIRDLIVHVDWKNVSPGTRTQKLEMLDPGGGSYQVMNTSFVEEVGGTGEAQTDLLIPISGSMITQRGMTGTWTLRVSLDGREAATQSITFEQ